MTSRAQYISYQDTGSFSGIVLDYLSGDEKLRPFYAHRPDWEGLSSAIQARQSRDFDRHSLHEAFLKQYELTEMPGAVKRNIDLLTSADCFTVCTAHQPNVFTGHLYVIYKILHAIRLAEELACRFPDKHFVPVFYMGSEDADIDELGSIQLFGKTYRWNTPQTGAVGRMKVDKALLDMIAGMEGQLAVEPYGKEMMALARQFYEEGVSIETATFRLLHELFGRYGLLVLMPDRPYWKRLFVSVMKREIEVQFSYRIVSDTVSRFPAVYKIQAAGRDINLFYLLDNLRERIIESGDGFRVNHTDIFFTREAILAELEEHPDRFSPNVILRPVFQETILPNIAFIGGGGEMAYWLELKALFEECRTLFPVLILRNSFMLFDDRSVELMSRLQLTHADVFSPLQGLADRIVTRLSDTRLDLAEEKSRLADLYEMIATLAGDVDPTLAGHADALRQKATNKLASLEKKMLSAARKKEEASIRQLSHLRERLFPGGVLQERSDNAFAWLSRYGFDWIDHLYSDSKALDQEFALVDVAVAKN